MRAPEIRCRTPQTLAFTRTSPLLARRSYRNSRSDRARDSTAICVSEASVATCPDSLHDARRNGTQGFSRTRGHAVPCLQTRLATTGQGHCFLQEQTGESRLIEPLLSYSPRRRSPSSLSIHRAQSRVRPKPRCHDASRNKRAHRRSPLRRTALPAVPADNASPNAPQEVDPLCG